METILSGLLGIMIGGVGVGIYYYKKTSNLYSQIIDKHTIIKLIKEHMAKTEKPRKKYLGKKYNSSPKPKAKTFAKKKSEKAS